MTQKAQKKQEPQEEVVQTGNQATVLPSTDDSDVKQVNIGLSESNKMEPDAGIQMIAPAELTEEVVKTSPYDPTDTRVQAELVEDAEPDTKVSKAKYNSLLEAFTHVLENTNLDVVQKMHYKNLAGIK